VKIRRIRRERGGRRRIEYPLISIISISSPLLFSLYRALACCRGGVHEETARGETEDKRDDAGETNAIYGGGNAQKTPAK
jgi:hypothetical protein